MWFIDPLLSGVSVNNSRCYAVGEKTSSRFYAIIKNIGILILVICLYDCTKTVEIKYATQSNSNN
jgi:hypothetical protein